MYKRQAKVQPVNDYGRIQPQAPELEEAVLGALMIEKDAYSLVSEILRPESFYEHRHQLIYSAITDLAVNQKQMCIRDRKYITTDCHIVIAGQGPLTEELKAKANLERVSFVAVSYTHLKMSDW